jgi:hypothetical protein
MRTAAVYIDAQNPSIEYITNSLTRLLHSLHDQLVYYEVRNLDPPNEYVTLRAIQHSTNDVIIVYAYGTATPWHNYIPSPRTIARANLTRAELDALVAQATTPR